MPLPGPSYSTIPRNVCLNILLVSKPSSWDEHCFPVPSQLPEDGKKTYCFVSEISVHVLSDEHLQVKKKIKNSTNKKVCAVYMHLRDLRTQHILEDFIWSTA